jgi:hypothetical protein
VALHDADVLRYAGPAADLVVDDGCFHSLPAARRPAYATRAADLTRRGGTFVLMAMAPRHWIDWRIVGPAHLEPEGVVAAFTPAFRLRERAESPRYWTDAQRIYRPLSGPYRATVYRFLRG